MNHIEQWQYPGAEKAYKAWRATASPMVVAEVSGAIHIITAAPRKYADTGRRKRVISAEQRENYRRGARKMWKRRKAEAR